MTDATIALKVDTSGLKQGQAEISKLKTSGTDAERSLNQSTDKVSKGWTGAKTAVVGLTAAVSALGAAAAVRQIVNYADAWQNATNQLKTVQKETESLTATQAKLLAVSNDSRQGFESTAGLYTRLSRATESLNLNQDELIGLTNTINKSFAVSGASATEANAAIVQLSQGLAAGALRGDEFNSVSEQSPILMQAIADSLKMTRGELRAFAGDGGITAEIVVNALQQASGEIDATFGKMSATFEQNMTVAGNNLLEFVGNAEIVKSTTSVVGSSIVLLSENIELVGSAAKVLATVLAARMIPVIASTSAAFIAGQIQSARYQATLISMAGVTKTAAAGQVLLTSAVSAFKVALALVGGPIGATVLALAGLAVAYSNVKKEQDKAREGAASFIAGNGGLKNLDLAIIGTQNEIDKLRKVIAEDDGIFAGFIGTDSRKAQGEIEKLEEFLADLKREHEALSSQQVETTETTNTLTTSQIEALGAADRLLLSTNSLAAGITEENRVIDEINLAQEESNRLKKEAAEQAKKVEDAIAKQVMEMNIEYVSLQLTSRQQAVFNAELKAFNEGAAPEAIRKLGELAGRNYDLEQAQKDATSASKELAKKTTTSTKSMETDFGRLGNTAVDTFAQMLVSGGDAMDGLKRVFENAIADMVSKFLKSGLADLFDGGNFTFGMGGGGGSSATSLLSGGSELLSLAGLGGSVTGFLSGATGTATGIAVNTVGPPTAAAMAGSGIMASVGAFLTSPVGIAAAALLVGKLIHDKTSNPDGYTRSSAGFLTAPTAGAKPGQTFAVDPFASGFNPIGFSDKKSREEAIASINVFRDLDKTITDLVVGAGGFVDLSKATLGGFGQDGVAGTSGTFLGLGGKTTEADLAAMANSYARQLANHIQGLTPEAMAQIMGAGSAAEIMKALEELSTANTTAADETTTADNANTEATTTATEEVSALSKILELMPSNLQAAIKESFLSLQGIEDINGLLFDSNNNLVDSNGHVVLSQAELNETFASLPPLLQQAVNEAMAPALNNNAEATTTATEEMDVLSRILELMPSNVRAQIQEAFLDLQGIEEVNGLLFDSNGSLVDINGQVIASQAELNETLASLPPLLQQAISQVMNPAVEEVAQVVETSAVQSIIDDPAKWGREAAAAIAKSNEEAKQKAIEAKRLADFASITSNPTTQGINDFISNYSDSAEIDFIRDRVIQFEKDTGLMFSQGGIDLFNSVNESIVAAGGAALTAVEYGRLAGQNYIDAAGITLGASSIDGTHASGLNSVPFDGYVAELHKGERVKTASEARQEDSMASMMGDLKVQIVRNTQLMLSIVQRWDFDGLPATRT